MTASGGLISTGRSFSVTDHVSGQGTVLRSVVSVRPPLSTRAFEPTDLWPLSFSCVWVMTKARRGLKVVKVIGQRQGLGLGLARIVTQSVWPQGQFVFHVIWGPVTLIKIHEIYRYVQKLESRLPDKQNYPASGSSHNSCYAEGLAPVSIWTLYMDPARSSPQIK